VLEWIGFLFLVGVGMYHTITGACTIFMMYYLFKLKYTSVLGWVEMSMGVLLLSLALLSKPF
jgi:hypothetical protein